MDICRACGELGSATPEEREKIDQLTEIYLKLTGIQLVETVDPGRSLFCSACIADLNHFDRFREKCLEVYQKLQEVKVEVWQEDSSLNVKVEVELEEPPEKSEETPKKSPAKATGTAKANQKKKQKPKEKPKLKPKEVPEISEDDEAMDDKDFELGDVDVSDDDGDDDDDGIGVGSGNDDDAKDSDDGSEYEITEIEEGTDKKSTKKPPKKRIRNRNRGGPPRPPGRPRIHPVDPNKKPPMKFINCPRCPKKVFFQHRLDAHLRVHDGLKPWLCKYGCGKSFVTYRNLKTHHIQIHTDDKIRLPCGFPGCDSVFSTKLGLQRHRLRVHDPTYEIPEQIPFICDLCGKSFTTNGGLKRHKYSHNPEEMPFICSICNKKFPTKSKIAVHTKRHQGIKEFACPQCGMMKPSKDDVRQHIKTVHEKHLRTEVITCDFCSKNFSSRMSLQRHINVVHLKIKQFTCSVCGSMFSRREHMNRHMKSHKAQDISSFPLATDLTISE